MTSASSGNSLQPSLVRPGAARICAVLHGVLAAVVVLIGASNMIAWLIGLDARGDLSLMRFNTAMALTLGGISLWLWRENGASRTRSRSHSAASSR